MSPLQQTRVEIFEQLFYVFLGLGTLVGIIVVGYTLYNAYKYRASGQPQRADGGDEMTLGELPTGGGKGKKLFVSFALSAIIVISLLVWSYTLLLDVENGPDALEEQEESVTVYVEGFAFGWNFFYDEHDGELDSAALADGAQGEMVVPEDTAIRVNVTSTDVWHAFGAPDQRVKSDAIPGEYDETWFIAEETGEYRIECFELCGDGHSNMDATLNVTDQETYEQWRENLEATTQEGDGNESNGDGNETSAGGNESTADGNTDDGNGNTNGSTNGTDDGTESIDQIALERGVERAGGGIA